MSEKLVEAIEHYQKSILKYTNDEERVLHCLKRLSALPIRRKHLEDTGVGKTVNSLRKCEGKVSQASRDLVSKWRAVVSAEPSDNENENDCDGNETDNSRETNSPETEKQYRKNYDNSQTEKEERKKHEEKSKHSSSKHKSDKSSKRRHNENDAHKHYEEKKFKSSQESDDSEHKVKIKNKSHSDESNEHHKVKRHKSDGHKKKEKHHSKHDVPESSNGSVESEKKHKDRSSTSVDNDTSVHKSSKHSKKHKHHKEKHKDSEKKSSSKPSTSKTKSSNKSVPSNGGDSDNDGYHSQSGTSFGDVLGMMEMIPSHGKKKSSTETVSSPKPKQKSLSFKNDSALDLLAPDAVIPSIPVLDLDVNLPTISPNYRPLPESNYSSSSRNRALSQEEALSIAMSQKNQRTKVYSGNKCAWSVMPTLFDLCIRILQENIDALEYTGGVPYSILLPILERASPDQLFMLEHHNPYLLEDTDVLWEQHCKREFRNKKREELESWREAYSRFLTEREIKLRALTANIKQSIEDKLLPVRQTKLAYVDSVVKPPRSVARKQAKWGTTSTAKPVATPASRIAALSNVAANAVAVPVSARAASASSAMVKPKKAPLMQKTLALIKNTNRYRR